MGKSLSGEAAVLAICLVVACQRGTPKTPTTVEARNLHNVFRVSDRIFSGSSPDNDDGFASLAALGIRTVISVDGATPDVAIAKRHGLSYVHVPIGYDGISRDKLLLLVKASRELPGPLYVHCHHGKHRGPAAVAAIQLCNDPTWTPERADAWMTAAGTDPRYTNLTGIARTLVKPTTTELAKLPKTFPEVATVADLTRHMVAVDALWDRLKLVKAANWEVPPKHPDIDPPHEVLQLVEHYREAARLDTVTADSPLARSFADAEKVASQLEDALRRKDPTGAAIAFAASANQCQTCHAQNRDVRAKP